MNNNNITLDNSTSNRTHSKCCYSCCYSRRFITTAIIVALIILTIILTLTSIGYSRIYGNTNTTTVISITIPFEFLLKNRTLWMAKPPSKPSKDLIIPVPYVIIHQTETENCTILPECMALVQQIQAEHMANGTMNDIGYNFLIGGDGFGYEGRGFYKEGNHTEDYNAKSIGIAFIGTFDMWAPPQDQTNMAQRLISEAIKAKVLSANYKILSAQQLQPNSNSTDSLYETIKTWPHWSETP